VVRFTPRPLYIRENNLRPLDRSLLDPQNRSTRSGEDRNFLPLPGIEFRLLGHPSRSPVGIPIDLRCVIYGLTYLGSMFHVVVKRKMTIFFVKSNLSMWSTPR
jgi:hypothetical protein